MPPKPYTVRNVTYQPVAGPGYVERGKASWYGQDFHGRRTANGEIFGAYYLTAASPVLPIPSYARVTNLENGRSVMVRVNDRGPYMSGRIIDMSYQAAEALGYRAKGSANVEVRYVGPAPLNIDDNKMLMASLNRETRIEQQSGTTMIAMADTPAPRSAPDLARPAVGRADRRHHQHVRLCRGQPVGERRDCRHRGDGSAAIRRSKSGASRSMPMHASVDLLLGVFNDQVSGHRRRRILRHAGRCRRGNARSRRQSGHTIDIDPS